MNFPINILIAECAIDFCPSEWLHDQKIKKYYQKKGHFPLQDASIHQHLLKEIPKSERLDRPDILHLALLVLLGWAKIYSNMKIYFSCKFGTFFVDSVTRIPRSQQRFYGLLENLFLSQSTKKQRFIKKIHYEFPADEPKTIFTTTGSLVDTIELETNGTYIFGGFAHQKFTTYYSDSKIHSLHSSELELSTALTLFLSKIK